MGKLIYYPVTKAQLTRLRTLQGFSNLNTLSFKIPLNALKSGRKVLAKRFVFQADLEALHSVGITDPLIQLCFSNHLHEFDDVHAYFTFMFSPRTNKPTVGRIDSE